MSVIAIGEPLLEFSQVQDADRSGATYKLGYGGDTSNFAVAVARQGGDAAYYTRIGDDSFGNAFLQLWRAEGVDTRWVHRDPAAFTGIYFITYTKDFGHEFTYFREGSAASRMTPDELPEEAIAGADFVHVSGISQAISASACDTVFRAIELARRHGVGVSYDPNVRPKLWGLARARAVITETARLSRVFLPSFEDAQYLVDTDNPDAIVDYYLNLGVEIVALKMGPAGVYVASATERHRIHGFSVGTVDTTGAGDTFDGAFVAELVAGRRFDEAATYANAAAALSTTGRGAVEPIPTRVEVEAFLARHRGEG